MSEPAADRLNRAGRLRTLSKRILQNAALSLLPGLVLFGAVELGLRAVAPPTQAMPALPSTEIGLDVEDPQLFWKMRPGADLVWDGVRIRTNSLGLRNEEVPAEKGADRVRILSLGESTTFGAKVEIEQTYSKRLETKLNAAGSGRSFEVINAGVAAYTSFQSMTYLRKEGLKLSPDVVLVYHEINDFLPTTLRTSSDIAGFASLTDRQLYDLRSFFGGLLYFLNRTATYHFMKGELTRVRIALLRRGSGEGERHLAPRIDQEGRPKVRVPRSDESFVFHEMLKLSRENGFRLVLIHPTYRATRVSGDDHECFLREFAARNQVPLVETTEDFAKSGLGKKKLFHDTMHPTALGHELIAESLYRYLAPDLLGTP